MIRLRHVTFNASAGSRIVTDPMLAFGKVIAVHREGKCWPLVTVEPTGSLQVRHRAGRFAQLRFALGQEFNEGEKLFVIYQKL